MFHVSELPIHSAFIELEQSVIVHHIVPNDTATRWFGRFGEQSLPILIGLQQKYESGL
jgi:hypothetical protein